MDESLGFFEVIREIVNATHMAENINEANIRN